MGTRRAAAAVDPGRLVEEAQRWRASQRIVLAAVVAAFPVLFILDDAMATRLSPVLPGLVFFALVLVGAPFAVMEALVRRERRRDPGQTAARVHRVQAASKLALGLAAAWFVGWLALGV